MKKIINVTKVKNLIKKQGLEIEMNKREFKNLKICFEGHLYINLSNENKLVEKYMENIKSYLIGEGYLYHDKNINLFKVKNSFRNPNVNVVFNAYYASPRFSCEITNININYDNVLYRVVTVFNDLEPAAVLVEEKYLNIIGDDNYYLFHKVSDDMTYLCSYVDSDIITKMLCMTHIQGITIREYLKKMLMF